MNVKALQRADRWVGVPLCWGLTVLRTLFSGAAQRGARPVRSLLIVKLAEQGSTVLAYAALRRATEIVGRKNVHFVAFEDNRFILDALEVIPKENVVTVSVNGLPAFLFSMLAAIRKLRRMKFDAAVDMEFFSRGTAALTFLSGAKQRVGFHAFFGAGPYRGDLMTHRLIYNPHLHTSQTFFTLIEALQCDPAVLPTFDLAAPESPDQPPQFSPGPNEVAVVEKIIQDAAGGQPPLILLNPNASDLVPLRRWPIERYVDLARRLLLKYPEIVVAFTGAPNEANAADDLVRQVNSSRCISLAGKTTLRQLLVLYTLAEVMVSNDSGPAHFATLTPIQVVTLFGPETPSLFAARTPRNTVLWAGIACSPCVNAYNNRLSPCRDNKCMQAIRVEQVFTAVCDAYAQRVRERSAVPVAL
ncbi:MAG TPA: glycosyltransferase family 9 protein [Opitutaceae bacterium]|nr:glycosyltransferase family 9 protein [Opitutaceae bacterium]